MNTDLLIKTCSELAKLRKDLATLETHEVRMELRVFTEDRWTNLSYVPTETAIRNMVIHQIRMELQNKIRKAKTVIRQLTRAPKKPKND